MASHVPFLAVRPDDQFASDVKLSSSMDARPQPPIAPTGTRLPSSVRLACACALSLGLSTLLHSFTAGVTGLELATASRSVTETWQVASLLAGKIAQLAGIWAAGYDYQDAAALTLLSNAPYYYLLYTLWSIDVAPILVALAVDVTTVALPFALLRPAHSFNSNNAKTTANEAVARDWQIDLLAAVLAAVVCAVTFYLTYLVADFSVFLVAHFDYIPTFERMHAATIPTLLQLFAVNGLAAMLFMFRPAMAASGPPKTVTRRRSNSKRFKPETATLGETISYNLGLGDNGPSHRAEVLAKRAGLLIVYTLGNTVMRVYGTVDGTDVVGTLGYGGLWAAANAFVAVSYAILGQE